MKYKKLIDNSKIPVLGLGTWTIGGRMEPDYSNDEKEINAIKKAIDLGYTLIDTAELYADGHTEELIGQAIKGFDRRKLFIVSKVFTTNLKYDDVISSCKKSLERVGTNYFDLYIIHVPNPEISLKETMKAFDYLIDQGMIKKIGVSDFDVDQMKEAQSYTKHKIAAALIEYNLLTRNTCHYLPSCINAEKEIIPYCQDNNIIVMAYRPIERGFLLEPHPLMDKLAKKYDKTKSQIAINWLINKKNIITIPKSSNEKHLKENLGSIGWKLNEEDIKLLDEIEFN